MRVLLISAIFLSIALPAHSQSQLPDGTGGGVVRLMTHGADGSLWLADSGVDRLARVAIR